MKEEVWKGHYLNRPFRIVVRFGKIVQAEGAPTWAKGMRIRHFKRTIWKGHSYVEREEPEDKCIEAPLPEEPADPELCKGAKVVDPVRPDDPVSKVRAIEARESSVPRMQARERRPPILITPGMSLKNALRAARKLGCFVHTVRRSGEIRIYHAQMKKRINANNRKKDAPRSLTSFLTQLQALDTS